MITKKTDVEMERARIIKVTRSLTRLKHSLNADIELNDTLPDRLIEFEKAVQQGQLLTLTVPEVTTDVPDQEDA